jgi:hypothetical protein
MKNNDIPRVEKTNEQKQNELHAKYDNAYKNVLNTKKAEKKKK